MKKIIFAIASMFMLVLVPLTPASAVSVFNDCTAATADTAICKAANGDKLFGAGGLWNKILNAFTAIIGAIAVLMIIVGALRYVTSNGEAAQLTSAKNTIMYSAIGLVLAVMANAIVNFVLTNI